MIVKSMSIDPEVVPASSSAGFNAVRSIPRWVIFGVLSLGVLLLVGILKNLLPLIGMMLLLAFIWKQATKH